MKPRWYVVAVRVVLFGSRYIVAGFVISILLFYAIGLPEIRDLDAELSQKGAGEALVGMEKADRLRHLTTTDAMHVSRVACESNPQRQSGSAVADLPSSVIRILSWTDKSEASAFFPEGRAVFDACLLPDGLTCDYTTNPDFYNRSDAILIRARRVKTMCMIPSHRFDNQKWIFYESESPPQVWSKLPNLDRHLFAPLFNITSTYSMDSTIPIHSQVTCTRDELFHSKLKRSGVSFAEVKNNGIAWFVSHCSTFSEREEYASELMKYIPVDIYGACGNLTCASCSHERVLNPTVNREESVLEQYKFYLAFENSLCKDYVTEKLWKLIFPYHLKIIPVVLGGADYQAIMPKDSFIDIRDFPSPKMLASYLHYVSLNDVVFNSYIHNKLSLRCQRGSLLPYECRLCQYLHENKEERQIIPDVSKYWSTESQCLTPAEFY